MRLYACQESVEALEYEQLAMFVTTMQLLVNYSLAKEPKEAVRQVPWQ